MRATGGGDGAALEQIVYEGYAPGGAAIMGTLADFGHTDGPDRSLTGADISKAMRGELILRELIGLMDLDRTGKLARHWYISATPAANSRKERMPARKRRPR